MRGDKVICHPWQRLIFSSCFWHSGPTAPLPQTTANCAVFIVRDLSQIFDPGLASSEKTHRCQLQFLINPPVDLPYF